MKYYYNDKLVRTSDHTYTHAVISTVSGEVIACRNGLENAEAAKKQELNNRFGRRIKYYEAELAAAKKGQDYFYDETVCRGRGFKTKVTHDAAELEIMVQELKSLREQYARFEYKIVELETR